MQKMNISLAHSQCSKEIRDNVNSCLDDNRIGQGRFNKQFEEDCAKYLGVKHAISVSSGSMADIVALSALKTKYPLKTEVIVPAYTFVAQTNAILINGLTPVFIDVKEDFQINIDEIKITNKTLCIFGVHLFGKNCNISRLLKFNVPVIEDTCEGFGGDFEGKKLGTFGDFGTYSFFPSHTITTGEGGMVVTNNDELALLARQISNHGRRSDNIMEKFKFDVFGFNGKMSNVLASIGCAILPTANGVVDKRRYNVELFNKYLGNNWFASSPHCYPIMCKNEKERDALLQKLWANGIECRKAFSCLPTQEKVYEYMGYKVGDFPIAESLGRNALYVPVHQGLLDSDIKFICKIIKEL